MTREKTDGRRTNRPLVAAIVQPVAMRLSRMEALLLEMRHEQDVQLKRVAGLHAQIETLTEQLLVNTRAVRRMSRRATKQARPASKSGG
jgi:hypothetical protein